jgi:PAS domain S-box-containing protein
VPAHWFVVPVALLSLLVVIGYVYQAAAFITFQMQLPMALNTACFFLAASLAIVATHPGQGLEALVLSDSAGGRITRRHLPALFGIPLVLGAAINLGMGAGWYGPSVGLALLTLGIVVLSILLTVATAGVLHRSDVALRRSEEHFRSLIENSSDCIMIFDRTGSVTYVGPSLQRILGHAPEEVLGVTAEALIHPDDVASVHDAIEAVFDTPGETVQLEFRIRHRDGSWRVFEWLGRTLTDGPDATSAVANARDITAHRETEEALLRAKEEAEQANRAKSEFLSRMSHELRTPLNSILGFAQLLPLGALDDAQQRAVQRISRAGDHLLMLINEVLDLARIEAGRQMVSVESVRLAGVLRETFELARPIATQYHCRLRDEVPPAADCFVLADRQRLTQVLLNLVTNAIKYNRPGGEVGMVVEAGAGDGRVAFGVWDTGCGIAADRLGELFTPFARLGAQNSGIEGTGLGLSLSRRFVEAMGGSMRVESEPDAGSTFWVELPAASGPAAAHGNGAASEALAREFTLHGTATVLYVEDNLANLDLIETLFASFPQVRLIPALQGQLAIDLAREHHPDLILLDLHLPDIPGEAVLQALLDDPRTCMIPIVIVSADATQSRIRRLLTAGARQYLTKPLDVRQLLGTVERLLAERPAAAGTTAAQEPEPVLVLR